MNIKLISFLIITFSYFSSVAQTPPVNTKSFTPQNVQKGGDKKLVNQNDYNFPQYNSDTFLPINSYVSDKSNSVLTNQLYLNNTSVDFIYTYNEKKYGTYDSTKFIAKFTYLGLSLSLFLISFYLFFVSNSLCNSYFLSKNTYKFNIILLFTVVFFNVLNSFIILSSKGLPYFLLTDEFYSYPNEFILGLILSSLLLLFIGIFRFTLIVYAAPSNKKQSNDDKFSIIAVGFSILNACANIATIWKVLNP